MIKLSLLVSACFDLIILILLIGVVLSWIPNIQWFREPFKTIKAVCDLFFTPFRKLIPPIGGIDFSPIIAFVVIQIAGNIITEILSGLGL